VHSKLLQRCRALALLDPYYLLHTTLHITSLASRQWRIVGFWNILHSPLIVLQRFFTARQSASLLCLIWRPSTRGSTFDGCNGSYLAPMNKAGCIMQRKFLEIQHGFNPGDYRSLGQVESLCLLHFKGRLILEGWKIWFCCCKSTKKRHFDFCMLFVSCLEHHWSKLHYFFWSWVPKGKEQKKVGVPLEESSKIQQNHFPSEIQKERK